MAFQGMDPSVIRDIAARLESQAGRIGEVLTSLQTTVSRARSSWRGPDQGGFDAAWSANHRPALAAAHAVVAELATTLRSQAGQQETTSSDLAGTTGGAGAALSLGAAVAATPPPPPPPAPVPDPLTSPEVVAALAGFKPGKAASAAQLDALTRALDDLPPDQRQILVDDLVKGGLLPQINASLRIDSLKLFGDPISNADKFGLFSALLSAASPAAIAALDAQLPISPSLTGVATWRLDGPGYDKPIYFPLSGSLFGAEGPKPSDLSQGQIGDCYLMSTLVATAQADPGFIASHIHDNGNGTTTVTLYENGQPVPVTVTNAVAVDNLNTLGATSQGGTWPLLYEKAYAEYRGGYAVIDQGDFGRDGLSVVTGQPVTTVNQQTGWTNDIPFIGTSPKAPNVPVSQIATLLDTHHAVLIGTNENSGNTVDTPLSDLPPSGLIENHEYAVQSVNPDGTVTLRNPWDPADTPTYSWAQIEKWSSEVVYTNTAP